MHPIQNVILHYKIADPKAKKMQKAIRKVQKAIAYEHLWGRDDKNIKDKES